MLKSSLRRYIKSNYSSSCILKHVRFSDSNRASHPTNVGICMVITCTCFRHSFNHSAEIFTLYNGDFDVHLYHSSGAVCGRKHWYIHLETGPSVYLHLFSSKVAYHSCFLITFHVPLLYLSCYVYM